MTQVSTENPARRILQRFILPADRDLDVMPLYVDVEAAVLDADKLSVGYSKEARNLNKASMRQSTSTGRELSVEDILGRHSLRVVAGETRFAR
jgi:galactofuranosylgalactofuranosylrhamnosyl-N-acetylglucosaminyl-diphospho-decaprenol beta-1,5/1,6-galactofuranosyltransferase